MSDARARRLDWGRRALDDFISTLIRIAADDRRAAELVEARVDHSLALILAHPGLGTRRGPRNERRLAVPGTGHVIHYRVFARSIRVTLWYRARQNIHRSSR